MAEAEAEADPYLAYGHYGYGHALGYAGYGYGLGHYGYAGLGHYGYAGLGHYYGKRSAEADAKADPYYYGGYYGHGLGYAGYHGLGYRAYGYGLGHYGYGHGYGYYGKRSAEAEPAAEADAKADPYYYGGYYG